MAWVSFDIPRTLVSILSGSYSISETNDLKPYKNRRDALGRPLVMPVILDNVLFDAVKISVSLRKHIVKTPVSGRQGSVKELIGAEDYLITMQGVLYSQDGNYPEEQVQILKELSDKNEPLKIENRLTDILEIDTVVIESLDFATTDKVNVQPFTLKLISDNEFEAILSDE